MQRNEKMALDVQRIRLTNDHTLETASEVMSQLQFERRLPDGRGQESYRQVLRNLGFKSEQNDSESYKQDVFQGQCLILGDARVGKTSLTKSLTGQPFDAAEPETKGVEMSLVDRRWKRLNADDGLKFGSFTRFRESALYHGLMFGPAGVEVIIDNEITSAMSAVVHLMFLLLRISWIISIVWLRAFASVSVSFYAYSIAVFTLQIWLQLQRSEHPEFFKLAWLMAVLPRILMGLGAAHVLAGPFKELECQKFDPSIRLIIFHDYLLIWVLHIAIVTILICDISYHLSCNHYFQISNWKGIESSVPGQAKFNYPLPFLPCLVWFLIPVMCGFSFGSIFQLQISTNMTTLHYCYILHFLVIPLAFLVTVRVTQALCSLVNMQAISSILLFYIIFDKLSENFNHFCSLKMYSAIFSVSACLTLYSEYNSLFSIFNYNTLDARETQATFTFIFIEKIALNFQKLRRALNSTFSSLKLKILDFSGDEEYYAYHHIFMRDNAIYLVLFNMTNFADDNFGNMAAKIERLKFWMESICSKASSKTPIFLVGTHRGHMEKLCLNKIDKHLQRNVLDSFSDELVLNKEDNLLYFPIENTNGKNDTGIQNLKRRIIAAAEECKTTIGREIPFSWIKIQDAIINLRNNKSAKLCVTLKDFPISVGNFICSNWSKETLKYFHEKGLIIYTDHADSSEWVLLKPQILTDIIIQLVTPPEKKEEMEQRGLRQDFKLLHDTGMLTESLLKNIITRETETKESEEAMKSFLEEYDIICPLFHNKENTNEAGNVTHFVPSLLPMSDVNTPVWQDSPTDKVFYVFFKRFLPEALFQHLLSRAHRSSKVEFPEGKPLICKDVGRFWWRPCTAYKLSQLKKEDMIKVTFTYRLVPN